MYSLLKPLVFLFPPEKAHHLTMRCLDFVASFGVGQGLLRYFFDYQNTSLQCRVMGIHFPNPVGLAAGFDKDAKHVAGLSSLGFGFIEVGTVTPLPQVGNPQPRLFRLSPDEALINRMGFNNEGLDRLVVRLKALRAAKTPIVIGGNIGKNKDTPNDRAVDDYSKGFEALFPWVDYFVVNVSSPNTPNLRALQEKEPLTQLLQHLQSLNLGHPSPKPILLKIAPDLSQTQLDDIADIVTKTKLTGIIATNTTISRNDLNTPSSQIESIGAGGLSGKPLQQRSIEVVHYMRQKLGIEAIIIGVGGIDSAAAAQQMMSAGANLIQLYTGFIYQGPGLVKKILKKLS